MTNIELDRICDRMARILHGVPFRELDTKRTLNIMAAVHTAKRIDRDDAVIRSSAIGA